MKKRKLPGQKVTMEERDTVIMLATILVILAVILLSILALSISVVPVCVIVLLEAGIVVCLHDVPIWLHGLVVLVQLLAGALCGILTFSILCATLYLAGILLLRVKRGDL